MIGTLGPTAFKKAMDTMSLEFLMLTMAKQMELNLTASGEPVNYISFYVFTAFLMENRHRNCVQRNFLKGTNPRVKVKHYSLPANF